MYDGSTVLMAFHYVRAMYLVLLKPVALRVVYKEELCALHPYNSLSLFDATRLVAFQSWPMTVTPRSEPCTRWGPQHSSRRLRFV